jgi:hypothetical protein
VIEHLSRVILQKLSQSNIEHLHDAVRAHHDVFGFDVAMHDARAVRRGQGECRLLGHVERFVDFHPAASQRRALLIEGRILSEK